MSLWRQRRDRKTNMYIQRDRNTIKINDYVTNAHSERVFPSLDERYYQWTSSFFFSFYREKQRLHWNIIFYLLFGRLNKREAIKWDTTRARRSESRGVCGREHSYLQYLQDFSFVILFLSIPFFFVFSVEFRFAFETFFLLHFPSSPHSNCATFSHIFWITKRKENSTSFWSR